MRRNVLPEAAGGGCLAVDASATPGHGKSHSLTPSDRPSDD